MTPRECAAACGLPSVESVEEWERLSQSSPACVTAPEPAARAALVARLRELGVAFERIVPTGNWIAGDVTFDEGCLCFSPVMIMPRSRVGRFVILMPGAAIGHDVMLGDFAFVGTDACVSGYVDIGREAVVDAGAVVVNGTAAKPLRIGVGARILPGAVVTRDVPDGATIAGNPGRRSRA